MPQKTNFLSKANLKRITKKAIDSDYLIDIIFKPKQHGTSDNRKIK
jgi:hypothetical protein